jgi:hypothetical protein
MHRLQPQQDQDRAALDTKLANQGIQQGSEAYNNSKGNSSRGSMTSGLRHFSPVMQEQQNEFGRGLASANFGNQAQQQAIQEANYFQTQPLNILNAHCGSGTKLRIRSSGMFLEARRLQPAPVYQAAQDQYAAAMQQYQSQLQSQSAMLGGIASLGGAAITKWSDRRLKKNIQYLFTRLDGLRVYLFEYIWNEKAAGVMADEVASTSPRCSRPDSSRLTRLLTTER